MKFTNDFTKDIETCETEEEIEEVCKHYFEDEDKRKMMIELTTLELKHKVKEKEKGERDVGNDINFMNNVIDTFKKNL